MFFVVSACRIPLDRLYHLAGGNGAAAVAAARSAEIPETLRNSADVQCSGSLRQPPAEAQARPHPNAAGRSARPFFFPFPQLKPVFEKVAFQELLLVEPGLQNSRGRRVRGEKQRKGPKATKDRTTEREERKQGRKEEGKQRSERGECSVCSCVWNCACRACAPTQSRKQSQR